MFEIAAGSALPLGFGGKAVGARGLRGEPGAVTFGVKPGDGGYGLERVVEIFVAPKRRRIGSGVAPPSFRTNRQTL